LRLILVVILKGVARKDPPTDEYTLHFTQQTRADTGGSSASPQNDTKGGAKEYGKDVMNPQERMSPVALALYSLLQSEYSRRIELTTCAWFDAERRINSRWSDCDAWFKA
jgi:hypothetical protein